MKKSNILIGIGAILWIIFAVLNNNFEVFIDLGFGYVPLIIIAIGMVWGLCGKEHSLAQRIFVGLYLFVLAGQLAVVVLYATKLIYSVPNAHMVIFILVQCLHYPAMLVFLPLSMIPIFDKSWLNKATGMIVLASFGLFFLKVLSNFGITKLHPITPHIYKYTKHITESYVNRNETFHALMYFMSVVAGIALLIWAILGVLKKRGSNDMLVDVETQKNAKV